MVVEAARLPPLDAALESADIVAPDGMPLVWVGRAKGFAVQRVCGPDFMPALLDRGRAAGRRHFFYGGMEGVAARLATAMQARFPGVHVVGMFTPPFRPLDDREKDEIAALINDARPDYVWVGVSTPKQDPWAAEQRPRLNASAILAVGAAFDFHAGLRRRAPRWMQRAGLEWLFRLLSEPHRLGVRYTVTNLRFLGLLLRDAIRPCRVASTR
jgi:N-acetylglucosaminyldiphosphoundecaprenol N-acetyl-beta-D-mannosaminyltransferase